MAAGRRERSVEELHNATVVIGEPKITPVLKGSYRMQGPVQETEHDIKKNMLLKWRLDENRLALGAVLLGEREVYQSEKRLNKSSMRRKVHTRVESGTCNVCSAPCSSCMHLKLSCMGSKGDEYSDENCRVTATSQNSVNEDDVVPYNNGAYDSFQHTASEASNLLSVNSSHDSLSENAESKANIRCSDIADASAESKTVAKLLFGGNGTVDELSSKPQGILDQKNFSNKNEDPKVVEGHDDNMSCVSRGNDVSTSVSHYSKNVERKNLSCSSALVSSLGLEGTRKAMLSPKSEVLETPSNNADAGSSSPNVQGRCLSSSTNCPHLEEDTKLDTNKVSGELYAKLEVEVRKDCGNQADGGFKCSKQVEQDEKSNMSVELPEIQEPVLQSVSGDDSDESEIVEHDVKVCDICGDAGREDMLAICSKCSDGAEHTYCMREMLQKVPEGDWLCEECKLAEETENQKQELDAEVKRMKKANTQNSIKRHVETIEAAPASKRQAIETGFGSPKSSSPTRTTSLSRDSSFKGSDKGKVKLAHHASLTNHNSVESPRLQPSKGILLKSNSFNTLNSKPKVKLVNEVPQKQKSSRDLDPKEGTTRMISKSMSFRSVNSGSESKVKLLAPRFSQAQDIKGLKQVKEQNALENKSLSKVDSPLGSSVTTCSNVSGPKLDQKLTPRGESAITSSTSNNRESKTLQSDGKSGSLLRSTSITARKGAENPVTSRMVLLDFRSLSMNGMSTASVEQKLNQVSPKDEPSSSSSWTAERLSNNLDENLQDGVSRSRESSNQNEKTRESSINRSRPAVIAGLKNLTCQKCKEPGHAAEFCTSVTPRASSIDIFAARSTGEEMNKSSKLKAAIEAAMLKKPGIFRKKKESDQFDGLSSSNMDAASEIASHDQLSSSNKTRNLVSDEGADEGQANLGTCSSETCKQININSMKHSGDAIFPLRAGDSDSMVKSSHALAPTPLFSKMLTIPEHEYIWQGAFEVRRGGKFLDIYGGMQAHLSTCASPKVLEVVNQFPHKITLDEVPRLSTWPSQFHDSGAKECNIALYFFSKDIESYEKSYKNLLDNMIKRDLALKGSFDGVEFLIFSSTQLPENSQRWNMLFFIWGVFRGRRFLGSDSLKNSVIPSSNMLPLDMNTPNKPDTSLNGDLGGKVSNFETNSEQQGGKLDSKSLSKNSTGNAPLSSEIRCTSPSQEEIALPDHRPDMRNKPLINATVTNIGSSCVEETQMHKDASCVEEYSTSAEAFRACRDKAVRGTVGEEKMVERMDIDQDEGVRGSVCEERVVDIMDIARDKVKIERNLNEDSPMMDAETSSGRELAIKGLDGWQSNSWKRPYLDLEEKVVETSDSMSQKIPWATGNDILVDGESINKKLKSGFCERYWCSNAREGNSFGDGFASPICDLGSSSSIEEKGCETVADEKVILEDVGTTERYFFPVDSRRVKDFQLGGNLMPWKEYSSNDEDPFRDGFPNLELALGAETKPQNKGIVPFFVGMVEKNNTQNKTPDKAIDKEEEDGVSATLSLSLSFPFPDKEQTVKPVSKTEQLLPERPHVNTSLLLFGGFPEK